MTLDPLTLEFSSISQSLAENRKSAGFHFPIGKAREGIPDFWVLAMWRWWGS